MREILFRGKRVDTGEWVKGWLCSSTFLNNTITTILVPCEIFGFDMVEVDPETVGQFTGLTDKNGKKIFEGDILEGLCGLHEVYFDEDFVCFDWKNISEKQKESFSGFADEYEIIGKIHDNPELLKGGDENA